MKNKEIIPEAKAKETAHFIRINATVKKEFDARAIFSDNSKKEITEKLFSLFVKHGDELFNILK
jgi:hypothetical protein